MTRIVSAAKMRRCRQQRVLVYTTTAGDQGADRVPLV